MAITLIPTRDARFLATKLSANAGISLLLPRGNKNDSTLFPDGEIYSNLPSEDLSSAEEIVILATGAPHPNECLVEIDLIIAHSKAAGKKVSAVCFTYYPYGMQDDIFSAGELNLAEYFIAKLVEHQKIERIYTVDAHFFGRAWIDKYPITNLLAHETLMTAARAIYPDAFFISADNGAQRRTNLAGFTKERLDTYTVDVVDDPAFHEIMRGKTVAIVDDIIETGGTLARIADTLKAAGVAKSIVLATHGVLESGIARVKSAYDDLFLSNSINSPHCNVDISSLIAAALKKPELD